MLFSSLIFIGFFIVVYTLYRISNLKAQNVILLVSSYIFYGAWDWRFLSLLMISTAVDFYIGKKIYFTKTQKSRRNYLLVSLIVNLGLLAVFKYYNFFSDNFQVLLNSMGMNADYLTLNIILPVGISFYTFQTLSYSIDIYRKKLKYEKSLLNFAVFVSFFPQLVAGPIERAVRFLPQISRPRTIKQVDIQAGLWLIFYGYFLKVFIADNLGLVVDQVFNSAAPYNPFEVTLASYSFAFQIFGDFAGYSSIAIGLARLMGIKLMTNFLYPYFVTNPQAFWKNWHISLSTWLRDYLYISLGGNRNGINKTYRNVFLTMLIGGLWHGAAWTFVIWGLYQGIIIIVYIYIKSKLQFNIILPFKLAKLLSIILMFQFTCIGWLMFRADNFTQLKEMLTSFFIYPYNVTNLSIYLVGYLVFHTLLLIIIQLIQYKRSSSLAILRLPNKFQVLIILTMYLSIISLGEFGEKQFIYFQF